jgi:hypothetical protein
MRVGPPLYAIAVVFLVLVSMGAQQDQSRIYSNVEYNEEGGDLLGVEVQLTTNGAQIRGQLKIYQGGCAAPVDVSGSLIGGKVDLSGKSEEYGKIELAGMIRDATIQGILHMEKAAKPEKVRLKKILKPHC